MNDFTKEELENIYDGLDDYWRMQPENEEFLHKIQHMIDNYCEHPDFKIEHHRKTYICTKCERVI